MQTRPSAPVEINLETDEELTSSPITAFSRQNVDSSLFSRAATPDASSASAGNGSSAASANSSNSDDRTRSTRPRLPDETILAVMGRQISASQILSSGSSLYAFARAWIQTAEGYALDAHTPAAAIAIDSASPVTPETPSEPQTVTSLSPMPNDGNGDVAQAQDAANGGTAAPWLSADSEQSHPTQTVASVSNLEAILSPRRGTKDIQSLREELRQWSHDCARRRRGSIIKRKLTDTRLIEELDVVRALLIEANTRREDGITQSW